MSACFRLGVTHALCKHAAAHLVDTTNGRPPMWSRWACVMNTVLLYTARCVQ